MKAFPTFGAVVVLLCLAGSGALAQTTSSAAMPAPPLASAELRPALDLLGRDLNNIHPERWKLNSIVRDQTATDLESIHRDLDRTLPPLLATADAAPTLVSAQLPVSRNITALYDVLVRLVERGRAAAPQEQESALEQARESLDTARRAFDDNLQTVAGGQEMLIKQLKTTLAAPPPPPPPPPPAQPARKKAKAKASTSQ